MTVNTHNSKSFLMNKHTLKIHTKTLHCSRFYICMGFRYSTGSFKLSSQSIPTHKRFIQVHYAPAHQLNKQS